MDILVLFLKLQVLNYINKKIKLRNSSSIFTECVNPKKTNKIIFLYIAILMVVSFTPYSKAIPFLALPLLFHLVFTMTKTSFLAIKKIKFLYRILALGFIVVFFHFTEYNLYYVARDIIYFIQAPMFIIIGICLCNSFFDFKYLLKVIIVTSFIVTLYLLLELVKDPSLFLQLGLVTRTNYNLSNPSALLIFTILFYTRKANIKMFKNSVELLIMSISFFSVLISFSRTFYILLLVMISLYYIHNYKNILKMYWVSVFFALFVIFGGLFITVKEDVSQDVTFESKMSHSLDEIIVKDYDSRFEIMQNWRGYEAFLGLSKFYEGNVFELLVGQGFGAVTYTPYWIYEGDEQFSGLDVLPMFHNGFITILLKTGIIGLLFFFLFLYKLLVQAFRVINSSFDKYRQLIVLLLQAVVFTILFRTFVVHGIFTTTIPFELLILLGATIKMSLLEQTDVIKN
ncbi:hypothetical protein [Flavobacterium ovatum]|uniref:O-antigen ligase family protein n=1 Tax=Flavobacterium ovatum TaxID=1928857 RepID=UPI00344D6641